MNNHPYWHIQTPTKPLYPDIEWSRPEQRAHAGRLGIIGGNKLGFAGVADTYQAATEAGAGDLRVLLPDALRKVVPTHITDAVFAATNASGSLAKPAVTEILALGSWSTGVLLAGDAGRSSETAIVYEDFLRLHVGPVTITRDAVDLVKNSAATLVERPNTLLVVSFAQLQKLFQAVYYPKMLTFSMQLSMIVEALHAFTITYPVTIMVLHKDHLLVASGGNVTSTEWGSPMAVWRGITAAKAASYWLWNQNDVLAAATASIAANTTRS